MATGTVKWFNGQKGFGFIAPDDGGSDVFVHISAVERAGLSGLAEGQKISYEVKVDAKRGQCRKPASLITSADDLPQKLPRRIGCVFSEWTQRIRSSDECKCWFATTMSSKLFEF